MPLTAKHSPQNIAAMRIIALNEMLVAEECGCVGLDKGVGLDVGEEMGVELDAWVELGPEDEPSVVPGEAPSVAVVITFVVVGEVPSSVVLSAG